MTCSLSHRAPTAHALRPGGIIDVVRLSQFWALVGEEFGESYASLLCRTHVLGALDGRTAAQALDDGVPPRRVWDALCDDMDVPEERRLGRDRPAEGPPRHRGPGAG